MKLLKFLLICKIIVSIFLFIAFATSTILSLIHHDWVTALLSFFATLFFGYNGIDALHDYWDYTEEDKDDRAL